MLQEGSDFCSGLFLEQSPARRRGLLSEFIPPLYTGKCSQHLEVLSAGPHTRLDPGLWAPQALALPAPCA